MMIRSRLAPLILVVGIVAAASPAAALSITFTGSVSYVFIPIFGSTELETYFPIGDSLSLTFSYAAPVPPSSSTPETSEYSFAANQTSLAVTTSSGVSIMQPDIATSAAYYAVGNYASFDEILVSQSVDYELAPGIRLTSFSVTSRFGPDAWDSTALPTVDDIVDATSSVSGVTVLYFDIAGERYWVEAGPIESVSAVIPEPATSTLVALGLFGFAWCRRAAPTRLDRGS